MAHSQAPLISLIIALRVLPVVSCRLKLGLKSRSPSRGGGLSAAMADWEDDDDWDDDLVQQMDAVVANVQQQRVSLIPLRPLLLICLFHS